MSTGSSDCSAENQILENYHFIKIGNLIHLCSWKSTFRDTLRSIYPTLPYNIGWIIGRLRSGTPKTYPAYKNHKHATCDLHAHLKTDKFNQQ